jgi:hypothetical protein
MFEDEGNPFVQKGPARFGVIPFYLFAVEKAGSLSAAECQ